MRSFCRFLSYGFMAVCFAFLVACHQVSQQNFDKIQQGMTMQQVTQILGKPTNVDSVNIAGLSGTSATWKSRDAVIVIQFLNDSVKVKTFNSTNNSNTTSTPNDDATQ